MRILRHKESAFIRLNSAIYFFFKKETSAKNLIARIFTLKKLNTFFCFATSFHTAHKLIFCKLACKKFLRGIKNRLSRSEVVSQSENFCPAKCLFKFSEV